MRLVLVPSGPLCHDLIVRLRDMVATTVPWEVETGEAVTEPPTDAYGQLDARDAVSRVPGGQRDRLMIGITAHDLKTLGFHFLFGYAVPGRYRAIVSLSRLHSGEDTDPDELILMERAAKEVLHEAGHLLGLGHCPDPNCVMHFSQALQDTDIKSERFCQVCARELSRLPESAHEG